MKPKETPIKIKRKPKATVVPPPFPVRVWAPPPKASRTVNVPKPKNPQNAVSFKSVFRPGFAHPGK